MSVPTSATSTSAVRRPTPGIVSSRATAVGERAQPLRDLGARRRRSARPGSRGGPAAAASRKRWWAPNAPGQRPLQLGQLLPQLPLRQLGQRRRVGRRPADQRRQHRPARDAQDVAWPPTASLMLAPSSVFCSRLTSRRPLPRPAACGSGSARAARAAAGRARSWPCSSPCRSRSAIHSQSLTSVLRPGTCLDVLGVDQQQRRSCSSSRFQTGFQYTPVLSIATWVHPAVGQPVGQRQQVVGHRAEGADSLHRLAARRRDVSRQATTVLLCTSSPQHRS